MKIKVALFDFDKTITDQDSIFLLYKKTIQEHKDYRGKLYKNMLGQVISVFRGKEGRKKIKSQFLQMLHLYKQEEIKEFVYQHLLEDHTYKEAKETIFHLKEKGYYLILVSASVEYYLHYVQDILPFDHVIGTKVNENFEILGENNKGEVKVENILSHLSKKNLTIDYENSLAFSDSYSADRPMMELVSHRYLINSNKRLKDYENLNWTL